MKLKLFEIESLFNELAGIDKMKGILSQKVNLPIKKKLLNLADSLSPHITHIRTINNEIIKELGVEKDGAYSIPHLIDDQPNPAINIYQEKYIELMNTEEEISVPELTIEDFDINTDEVYPIFLTKIVK